MTEINNFAPSMKTRYVKVFLNLVFLMSFALVFKVSAPAFDLKLAWDPNIENNLAGYIVYHRAADLRDDYLPLVNLGLDEIDPQNPTVTIYGFDDNSIYYFSVTAYDDDDKESGYSDSICVYKGNLCGGELWHDWFAVDPSETPMVGDFNGDGLTDIITFTRNNPNAVGDVYVALSDGKKFGDNHKWHDWFAISHDEDVIIGDYDGDGIDDIATWLKKTTKQIYVALSNGLGMKNETVWLNNIGFGEGDLLYSGDVNGDFLEDLILFARSRGEVYVALSTGSGFALPQLWHDWFVVNTYERPRVGDLNGDGFSDIITFATDSSTAQGDVYVAMSDGKKFGDNQKWHDWFSIEASQIIRIGDSDGDLKDDLFTFMPPPSGQVYSVISKGTHLAPNVLFHEILAPTDTDLPLVGDVNGDGKTDIIVFSLAEGNVRVALSN